MPIHDIISAERQSLRQVIMSLEIIADLYSSQMQSSKTPIGCQVLIPIQLYEINQTYSPYTPQSYHFDCIHIWIKDLV